MAKLTEIKEEDPEPVKKRVQALKKIQSDVSELETQYHKEYVKMMTRLREKYGEKLGHLQDLRAKIVTGEYEPSESECDFPEPPKSGEDGWENYKNFVKELDIEDGTPMKPSKCPKGIPQFWLTAFKNDSLLKSLMVDSDDLALKKLTDVSVEESPKGFKINFHFAPNDFFKNEVLSKEFVLEYNPKSDEPFQPGKVKVAFTCGTVINWKSGKDLTKRTIKEKVPKTKRSKAKGKTRNVTKIVNREKSFFYFFNDDYSKVETGGRGPSSEFLEFAFNEVGLHLRNKLVPRAVLYYADQAPLEDSESDDELDDEEENDTDSEDGLTMADIVMGHILFGGGRGRGRDYW